MDRLLFIYLPALLLFLTMQADIPENDFPETVPSAAVQTSLTSGTLSSHNLMAAASASSDDMITEKKNSSSRHSSPRSLRFQKSTLRTEISSKYPGSDNMPACRQSYDRFCALRHDPGTYLRLLHTLVI